MENKCYSAKIMYAFYMHHRHVRLPFYPSQSSCVKPFQLVHCDLWTSPIPSPKAAGGLGVKNLVTRNICLLLKFSYKFLHSNELSWKKWITQHSTYPLHHTSIKTFLATIIKKNIHLLRQILAAPLEMALAPTSG